MKPRSAIKNDMFSAESRAPKIDNPGDPLVEIRQVVDFGIVASKIDRVALRVVSAEGSYPPFPAEMLVRIQSLKRLNNLSDEQVEFQMLHRFGLQHFYGVMMAAKIPDSTTAWTLGVALCGRHGSPLECFVGPIPQARVLC